MGEKKRIEWIDLAKGICMILVVWIHVRLRYKSLHLVGFNWAATTCYYFRMPLYFFLSGLFFKSYGNYFTFLKKKAYNLLLPFATFASVAIVYRVSKYYIFDMPLDKLPSLISTFYPIGPIWFLLCLFWMNQVFFGISALSRGRLWALYSMCIVLGVIGFHTNVLPFWLHFETAFTALPFFVAGYAVRRHTHFLQSSPHYILDTIIAVAIGYGLYRLTKYHHESILFDHNKYGVPVWALYFGGLIGTAMVFLVARMVKWLPVISYIGRYSIIVLITHHALIVALDKSMLRSIVKICGGGHQAVIATTIVVLLISVPIIWFCKRYMPYVFAQAKKNQ